MGDGQTKKLPAVMPGAPTIPGAAQPSGCVSHMVKNLLILGVGATEFTETRDLSYHETVVSSGRIGIFLLAARRSSDGLWIVLKIVTQSGCLDKLIRGKPRGQILGLTLVSGEQPLYVGWPANSADNRPRVYQGEDGEGKPYDAIDHKELRWVNGEPFYPASEAGKEFVVHGKREARHYDAISHKELQWVNGKLFYPASEAGKEFVVHDTREGERFDEIERPILFPENPPTANQPAVNQPFYRARLGREKFLVWGTEKSKPCDDVSPPEFNGKEVVAWAIDGVSKFQHLSIKKPYQKP